MTRSLALILLIVILTACAASPTPAPTTATPAATATPAPTATLAPTATPDLRVGGFLLVDGKVYAAADDGSLTEQQVPAKAEIASLSLQENTVLALDASGTELARFKNGAWVEAMTAEEKAFAELQEPFAKQIGSGEYAVNPDNQVVYRVSDGAVVAYMGGENGNVPIVLGTPGEYVFQLTNGKTHTMPMFANLRGAYDYILNVVKPSWGKVDTWFTNKTHPDNAFATETFPNMKRYKEMDPDNPLNIWGEFNYCLDKDCGDKDRVFGIFEKYYVDDGLKVLNLSVRKTSGGESTQILVLYDANKFADELRWQQNKLVIGQ